MRAWLMASIMLLTTVPGRAAEIRFQSVPELTKFMIENVRTKEEVLKILETARVSREAMQVIGEDLKKRLSGDKKPPKLRLINDQLQIEGRKTPLKVVSYEPLKIRIKDQEWAYDEEKLADENYQNFIDFVSGKKQTSWFPAVLPQAHANLFSNPFEGMLNGGWIGALAGIFIGVGTNSNLLMSGISGGATGMIFGGLVGAMNQSPPSAYGPASQGCGVPPPYGYGAYPPPNPYCSAQPYYGPTSSPYGQPPPYYAPPYAPPPPGVR